MTPQAKMADTLTRIGLGLGTAHDAVELSAYIAKLHLELIEWQHKYMQAMDSARAWRDTAINSDNERDAEKTDALIKKLDEVLQRPPTQPSRPLPSGLHMHCGEICHRGAA